MDIWEIAVLSIAMLIVGIVLGICITYRKDRKTRKTEEIHEKGIDSDKKDTLPIGEYERFTSVKLLEILGIAKIANSSFHVQKEIKTVIMESNLMGFDEIVNELGSKATYDMINSIMKVSLPTIDQYGGMVNSFNNAGFQAIFAWAYGNILNAAVTICESINKETEEKDYLKKFSIGLAYGDTMVGLVGNENRMDTLVLSTYTRLASYLQSICDKYYCKILATGSLIDLIPEAKIKFTMRFIGYIYISETKQLEKLYDVFDGDVVEIRNQKRKTKKVFEKGVDFFTKRQFLEARNHFIEVMKTDRRDNAAKVYLLECDKYLSEDYADEPLTYIEKI